jgi:hypothetical protein
MWLVILSLLVATAMLKLVSELKAPHDFVCHDLGRALTDAELIEQALDLEVQKEIEGFPDDHPSPESFRINDTERFLATHPDCCSVWRDPRVFRNPNETWLDKWLKGQLAMIVVEQGQNPPKLAAYSLMIFVDECGRPNMDRSYFVRPI